MGHCQEGHWQCRVQGGGSWGLHHKQSEGQGGGGGMAAVRGVKRRCRGMHHKLLQGPGRMHRLDCHVAPGITWSCWSHPHHGT